MISVGDIIISPNLSWIVFRHDYILRIIEDKGHSVLIEGLNGMMFVVNKRDCLFDVNTLLSLGIDFEVVT